MNERTKRYIARCARSESDYRPIERSAARSSESRGLREERRRPSKLTGRDGPVAQVVAVDETGDMRHELFTSKDRIIAIENSLTAILATGAAPAELTRRRGVYWFCWWHHTKCTSASATTRTIRIIRRSRALARSVWRLIEQSNT